jgi:GSH-dependent disulfide-bond oxidoreductase
MIDLYGGATPNSRKVAIALHEMGEPFTAHHVDIERGAQHASDFLMLNPNAKQPVIVDRGVTGGPLVVWESGAILLYLADKHNRLNGDSIPERAAVWQWLMWQMSAVGPTGGQISFFGRRCPRKLPIAIERFTLELHRLWSVLDGQLAERPFVAGPYSVADIALYPWWVALREVPVVRRRTVLAERWLPGILNLVRSKAPAYPNVQAWAQRMSSLPAVQSGMRCFE